MFIELISLGSSNLNSPKINSNHVPSYFEEMYHALIYIFHLVRDFNSPSNWENILYPIKRALFHHES